MHTKDGNRAGGASVALLASTVVGLCLLYLKKGVSEQSSLVVACSLPYMDQGTQLLDQQVVLGITVPQMLPESLRIRHASQCTAPTAHRLHRLNIFVHAVLFEQPFAWLAWQVSIRTFASVTPLVFTIVVGLTGAPNWSLPSTGSA